jgi:hypothetical protein
MFDQILSSLTLTKSRMQEKNGQRKYLKFPSLQSLLPFPLSIQPELYRSWLNSSPQPHRQKKVYILQSACTIGTSML